MWSLFCREIWRWSKRILRVCSYFLMNAIRGHVSCTKKRLGGVPKVALWVKDPALSLSGYGFDQWVKEPALLQAVM